MKLEHDLLSADDILLLQEFARRLYPRRDEFIDDWTNVWQAVAPKQGVDLGAHRQVMEHTIRTMAVTHLDLMEQGRIEDLYQIQYNTNREAARRQLGPGAITVATQRDLHALSRALYLVVQRWVERLFVDDPQRVLLVMLAQMRMAAQMAQITSEAYGDEREAFTSKVDERLRYALDLTQRLSSLAQALVQSLDSKPVFDLAMQTAVQLLHTDGAALMLADASDTVLHMHTLVGRDLGRPELDLPIEGTMPGWVYRNDRPLRSDRLPSEALTAVMKTMRSGPIQSLLVVPLRVHGKPVGTMAVACESERTFTDSEVQVLQTLADYAAIALENARTYAAVLEAGEQAKRSDRAKSEFVAAVSHEIRSPLNAFVGYIGMLREEVAGPLTDEQRHLLERLEQIAQATYRLTEDLLENARIEAGKLRLQIGRVELRPLLEEVKDALGLLVEGKPITVEMHVSPDLVAVRADPDRLRQVVVNFTSNAAKFTREGVIRLQAALDSNGTRVQISVHDSGPGIHPDDLPHLFELFYRGRGSEVASGAGIGLFLSRQLAAMMEGGIHATSELGQGTCFTLSLPAWPEA